MNIPSGQYSPGGDCLQKPQTTFSEGSAHLPFEAILICIYFKGTFLNVHDVSCLSSMSKNAGYVPQVHRSLVVAHLFDNFNSETIQYENVPSSYLGFTALARF